MLTNRELTMIQAQADALEAAAEASTFPVVGGRLRRMAQEWKKAGEAATEAVAYGATVELVFAGSLEPGLDLWLIDAGKAPITRVARGGEGILVRRQTEYGSDPEWLNPISPSTPYILVTEG